MKQMLKGKTPDIIDANVRMLKESGYSHARALRCAMCHANKKHSHDAKRIGKKVATKSPDRVTVV